MRNKTIHASLLHEFWNVKYEFPTLLLIPKLTNKHCQSNNKKKKRINCMLVYHRPSHTGQRFEYYTSKPHTKIKREIEIIITILQHLESEDIPPPQDSNYQKP